MDETCAHILDPIPDEQYLEARDATGGKPAGVRFLAFNTIIDIEAYGEAAACRAAFEEAGRSAASTSACSAARFPTPTSHA